MVHKLLIKLDYSFSDPLANLLAKEEFPRAATVELTYKATNVADIPFPGGVLKEVRADLPNLRVSNTPNTTIDPIAPNETKVIHQWKVFMSIEGIVWIRCQIHANDNQPIEYFQSKTALVGTENWHYPFTVINREWLETIKLLKEISSKLDQLLKK